MNDKRISSVDHNWDEIIRFFPSTLRSMLKNVNSSEQSKITEIRMRIGRPIEIITGNRSYWLNRSGGLESVSSQTYILTPEDFARTLNSITNGSFYALEEEFAQGYLTLPGGHRVGFTGHVILETGKIKLIRDLSSLNLRIARQIRGIARPVLPFLWKDSRFLKTLILSPPASGKTTLLREIIREVSDGCDDLGIDGIRVGVVDERSELAGSYLGIPQLDVGKRTDVLDACPKSEGVYLLLRAMNPKLIATDEIGNERDYQVIEDIINAGVSFIATAHAHNLTEALCRPGLKQILENGMIERIIILSNRLGIGTVESIKAGISGPELFNNRMQSKSKEELPDG